jgi:hypothetical protein
VSAAGAAGGAAVAKQIVDRQEARAGA